MTENLTEKLNTIAENQPKIFEAGVEAGKKAEYDAFWDDMQRNGVNPMHYGYAFCNSEIWTQEHIEKVKYKRLLATYFSVVFMNNTSIVDLSAFSYESEKDIWGLPSRHTLSATFSGCINLEKCMVINFDCVGSFANAFAGCSALQNVPVKGELRCNGLSFQDSPLLNKSTIVNVMNCASTIASGYTITFSKIAVDKAFETSENAVDGSTSAEWLNLIATKPNWTISLV